MSVKELLQLHGLTAVRLSEKLGIPYRTVAAWVSGERTPPDWVVGLIEYRLKGGE